MWTKQFGVAVTPGTRHFRISASMLFIVTGLSCFSAVTLAGTAISSGLNHESFHFTTRYIPRCSQCRKTNPTIRSTIFIVLFLDNDKVHKLLSQTRPSGTFPCSRMWNRAFCWIVTSSGGSCVDFQIARLIRNVGTFEPHYAALLYRTK